MRERFASIPLEAWIWIVGLMALGMLNTPSEEGHFSLCIYSHLGFTWCPGCGLGRSIALFLQGHWIESFHMHWLGIPAAIILAYRTFQLLRKSFKNQTI